MGFTFDESLNIICFSDELYPPLLIPQYHRLAQVGYEMEKKSSVSYVRPNYAAFYPKGATPYAKPGFGQTTLGGYGAIAGLLKKVRFKFGLIWVLTFKSDRFRSRFSCRDTIHSY